MDETPDVQDLSFRAFLRTEYHRAVNLLTEAAWKEGLSPLQYHALIVVGSAPGKISQRDLVAQLGSSKSQVSTLVKHLEEQGLICVQRAEYDRRKVVISLTPEGKQCLERVLKNYETVLKPAIKQILTKFPGLLERAVKMYAGLNIKVELIEDSTED
jgi:DNA-binding MarR family transcriptional regulator